MTALAGVGAITGVGAVVMTGTTATTAGVGVGVAGTTVFFATGRDFLTTGLTATGAGVGVGVVAMTSDWVEADGVVIAGIAVGVVDAA